MQSHVIRRTCRSSRWLGGLGAILGCSGMIIAALAGGAGAAATGASMAGMEQSSSNPGWVNAINSVGQPLLIISLVLIIFGLWPRGRTAVALALLGSMLFYVFMFVHYNLPLAVAAGLVLAAAYVSGYWPSWRRSSSSPA